MGIQRQSAADRRRAKFLAYLDKRKNVAKKKITAARKAVVRAFSRLGSSGSVDR